MTQKMPFLEGGRKEGREEALRRHRKDTKHKGGGRL